MSEHLVDKCPECGDPFVDHGGTSTTLVGCSSPDGHDHDVNCLKREYRCKNGHYTVLSLVRTCPACEWTGPDTCFCHEGKKIARWPGIPS